MSVHKNVLYKLETGNYKEWDLLVRMARYFKKKIRVEFY